MTAQVDIVNRALQAVGTRTSVSATELLNSTSNEAIQANLSLLPARDELIRMAPWNFATNWVVATLITAVPGTPENSSPALSTWSKGIPPPPWAYEYQYPVDCLRPLYIVPQYATGFASGVPITTAVTGGAPSFWNGPPVRFKVGIDQFIPVTAAAIAGGGTGHAVGDIITLASGPTSSPPIGAPVRLLVTTVGGGGVITGVSVVNQVQGESSPLGGSYFAAQTNPVAQGSTTGSGVGAAFNLTFGASVDQRVILTNQENAILCYLRQVQDPNTMDPEFINAWISYLGAKLAMALTGDKALANLKITEANSIIVEARKNDANEGLTINNVTPDFIRIRGIYYDGTELSPSNLSYEWGPLLSTY